MAKQIGVPICFSSDGSFIVCPLHTKREGSSEKYRATRFQQDSPGGSPIEAMISYGHIDEKGADEPDPAYLYHGGEFELRNDKTAGDGLNGSISLSETDLEAIGADPGDKIRVYAEANGRWILYERDSYSDRAGVGIPKGHREKLNLGSDSRRIEIWLDEAETDSDTTASESAATQVSLTGEKTEQRQHVLIPANSAITYHNVSSSDDTTTECGIDFQGETYRLFSDPGDALDQCTDCAVRSSDDMTNKELVEWLGEQAGFEAEDGTPAYLSKEQLVALRDYVLDLEEQVADSDEEGTDASMSARTVVGSS
ncbi:hypothetical protein PN419_11430 [Halorubrum ezzemoulense]|uniref:hypothetical protein n=1 Tax=Halorubrum ezzemoulense TaxID=337243 RepID=UPI00232CB470|nr:hypothetical protein [Halorubrum ezzemoulense]MDB9249604.1 hypothetical protein [Halorubrum ezzemoulense]MDB9259394.1 hypothetical protein [Halorubrum ezzemoulense]MDB9263947.1 hypothetical protein [Halorubrum ezzemoulense]MDB9266711.1 hypothetical protein [Halorubrum ezzemoulense]MDB9269755.1 hypothetical protein [Halorubrum ezzemoulense]